MEIPVPTAVESHGVYRDLSSPMQGNPSESRWILRDPRCEHEETHGTPWDPAGVRGISPATPRELDPRDPTGIKSRHGGTSIVYSHDTTGMGSRPIQSTHNSWWWCNLHHDMCLFDCIEKGTRSRHARAACELGKPLASLQRVVLVGSATILLLIWYVAEGGSYADAIFAIFCCIHTYKCS